MPNTYSYSKLSQFDNCPRQYKFNHIEKATVEKPVGVEMFLGSTVHRALEKLYKFKVNGRIQPEEEMLAGYHAMWEGRDRDKIKVTQESMAIDDMIGVGDKALRKYYQMYHPFDEGEILGLENNVNFPLDSSNRFMIRAKLDKLVRRDDGVVEIVDYKTQQKLPTQQSLDVNMQMGLYQVGVNFLWPQFDKIELKQIYLRHSVAMSTSMSEDLIEELRQGCIDKILEIEKAVHDDNFPVKESGLCDYCVYYNLCPAKRHRLALEEDSEELFDAESGKKLAEKYLKLNHEKKVIDSELKALKDDIVKYCRETDLTRLDADSGYLNLTISESEGFPGKTEDNKAFIRLSQMARAAGLDECFKLEPNVLYKEFFAKERLEPALMEELRQYLRTRISTVIRTKDNIENGPE